MPAVSRARQPAARLRRAPARR